MPESDPADLAGDGSFDAIDITILEGEDNGEKKRPVRGIKVFGNDEPETPGPFPKFEIF